MNRGVKWSRGDTHVLLACLLYVAALIGLAFAPFWVLVTTIVLAAAGMCFGFWWVCRKPLNETDRYCARVDVELDRHERFVRELARIDRGGGFRG